MTAFFKGDLGDQAQSLMTLMPNKYFSNDCGLIRCSNLCQGRIAWLGGFAKKEKAHLQVRSKPNKN